MKGKKLFNSLLSQTILHLLQLRATGPGDTDCTSSGAIGERFQTRTICQVGIPKGIDDLKGLTSNAFIALLERIGFGLLEECFRLTVGEHLR